MMVKDIPGFVRHNVQYLFCVLSRCLYLNWTVKNSVIVSAGLENSALEQTSIRYVLGCTARVCGSNIFRKMLRWTWYFWVLWVVYGDIFLCKWKQNGLIFFNCFHINLLELIKNLLFVIQLSQLKCFKCSPQVLWKTSYKFNNIPAINYVETTHINQNLISAGTNVAKQLTCQTKF